MPEISYVGLRSSMSSPAEANDISCASWMMTEKLGHGQSRAFDPFDCKTACWNERD